MSPPAAVETLEERLSYAIFDRAPMGLDQAERDALRDVLDLLTDWLEERGWEGDTFQPDPDPDEIREAWDAGFDAAVDYVRECWKTSGPVARGVLAALGDALKKTRDEGPADG